MISFRLKYYKSLTFQMRLHFNFSCLCHHRNSNAVHRKRIFFFVMLPKYTLTGINIFDFKNVRLLIVRNTCS